MQNELPEWCPQWAWDEAYKLASQVVAERGTRMEAFQPIVARALVAAERRGVERAAMVAEAQAEGWAAGDNNGEFYEFEASACLSVAAAIRQLGEKT